MKGYQDHDRVELKFSEWSKYIVRAPGILGCLAAKTKKFKSLEYAKTVLLSSFGRNWYKNCCADQSSSSNVKFDFLLAAKYLGVIVDAHAYQHKWKEAKAKFSDRALHI